MAYTIVDTSNFEIRFDPSEFTGPGELAGMQSRSRYRHRAANATRSTEVDGHKRVQI